MTNVDTGCLWHSNVMGTDALAAQVVGFARRLQQIDPVFAAIALSGTQFDLDGLDNWMRQPLVWDLTRDQWRELVPNPGRTSIYCWNRRLPGKGGCLINIRINGPIRGNGVSMNNIPLEANNPQALTGVLAAMIESFGADQAQVLSAWDMELHPSTSRGRMRDRLDREDRQAPPMIPQTGRWRAPQITLDWHKGEPP